MARKKLPKDPMEKRWKKLRSAIRNVWQYDHERKAIINGARFSELGVPDKLFECPLCQRNWPIELATVDHDPQLGGFHTWDEFFDWTRRCFEGPQRAVCKPCHRKKTTAERRKNVQPNVSKMPKRATKA